MSERRRQRVPDRWLPVGYLLFAHLCLLAACLTAVVSPRALGGFHYHPRMIAVVHLVTLGWISGSILGSLHLILPMALRSPLPARPADRWAFVSFAVGTLGMVSHFWIGESSGMVWSALLVVGAVGRVAWRTVGALHHAPVPFEHRLPFYLAFANVVLAALLGIAIGLDKSIELLPGASLDHVNAHAHLAVLGWATFMVMGAAYRLVPMMLPSAVPTGADLTVSSVAAEIGVLWLAFALASGSAAAAPMAAGVYLVGIALFLRRLLWMRSHPRPPAKQLVRPDYGVLHLAVAFAYLQAAIGLGLALVWLPLGGHRSAVILAYGTVGLIGFLAQMVAGVSVRILPLFAWLREFADGGFVELPPSPHAMVHRPLHRLAFWLWVGGPAILAFGLAKPHPLSTRLGGLMLATAVTAGAAQLVRLLRRHERTAYTARASDGAAS